jgi:hypothetical protein
VTRERPGLLFPARILEPLREEFLALLPVHRDDHSWGCHNPRIADDLVFERLILVLVSGMGYERVADVPLPLGHQPPHPLI